MVNLAIGEPIWVRGASGDQRPGSLGAYVSTDDGLWLLSANHVLAANGAFLPLADPQHGVYAGTQRISRTIVFAPLRPNGNRADVAACLLAPPAFRPVWPPGWRPSPHPHDPPLRAKLRVSVAGQDRFGHLAARGTHRVSMKHAGFPGSLAEVEFLDSLLVKVSDPLFKRPGNSGRLVVTAGATCRPVGLIIGTAVDEGSDYVVLSPLAPALAALGLPQALHI